MIGVTITAGDKYKPVCDEAVKRFKKHTGIKTVVIIETDITDKRYAFFTKLRLHTMLAKTSFVFFDADLWFMNDVDLSKYDNINSFVAVKDVGRDSQEDFPVHDCHLFGIDKNKYFNSGLFIVNGRSEVFASAMEFAAMLWKRVKPFDFGEQSILNAAIQRYDIPIEFLDHRYNYPIICDQQGYKKPHHIYSSNPFAIHALGYRGDDKEIRLNQYLERHSKGLDQRLPEAIHTHHTYSSINPNS